MPYSVNQAIADFRLIYPDCDPTTSLSLINRVHRKILSDIYLQDDTQTVPLQSGQTEYPLDNTILKVWSARYVRSALRSDQIPLQPTAFELLESDEPSWRTLTPSEPRRYYVRTNKVGLVSPPAATSLLITSTTANVATTSQPHNLATGSAVLINAITAYIVALSPNSLGLYGDMALTQPITTTATTIIAPGFPAVILEVSRESVLQATDNLPDAAPEYEAWVNGVSFLWAKAHDLSRALYWEAQYKEAKAALARQVSTRNVPFLPRLYPAYGVNRTRRI